MKRTLEEELQRIHELTYGKRIIKEQEDSVPVSNGVNTDDNVKKPDLVSDDVDSFYQTLEDAANSGGLTQQRKGTMTYVKGVESMQIGLILLGYPLPVHGVDGLFGPETANAVRKFISDNLTLPNYSGGAPKEMLLKLVTLLKAKGVTPNDIKRNIDAPVATGGGESFVDIDLSTQDGYDMYSEICQAYIDKINPSAGITGVMLAEGAKSVMDNYHKYVPPQLALAQLTLEGGLVKNPNAKPIRTNNPFNVGNDTGKENVFPTKQDGINQYYSLIARKYMVGGKTASDIILNFVNKNGNRYAPSNNYESSLSQIVSRVNTITAPILASFKSRMPAVA